VSTGDLWFQGAVLGRLADAPDNHVASLKVWLSGPPCNESREQRGGCRHTMDSHTGHRQCGSGQSGGCGHAMVVVVVVTGKLHLHLTVNSLHPVRGLDLNRKTEKRLFLNFNMSNKIIFLFRLESIVHGLWVNSV